MDRRSFPIQNATAMLTASARLNHGNWGRNNNLPTPVMTARLVDIIFAHGTAKLALEASSLMWAVTSKAAR
jgi:hypothetical protein